MITAPSVWPSEYAVAMFCVKASFLYLGNGSGSGVGTVVVAIN